MIRIWRIGLLFLAGCALSFAAQSEETFYGDMMVVQCKEWVSLREEPDKKSRRLEKVPLSAVVTEAEWFPECGEFLYCCYDDSYGYILSQYLVPLENPELEGEVRFTSGLGFSFFYSPEDMEVDADSSEDGKSLRIEALNVGSPVYLELMALDGQEAAWDFLAEKAGDAELDMQQTQYGQELVWFQRPAQYNQTITETHYALDGDSFLLEGIGSWPQSSNGRWLEAFTEVLKSIEFTETLPVKADWSGSTGEAFVVDEDGEYVRFSIDGTVTGLALLSLELSGGEALFKGKVLHEFHPSAPAEVVVKIAFPGDIPSYGIRVADKSGRVLDFALSISGRDGRLELEKF